MRLVSPYTCTVIVTCPNCGARYRLKAAPAAGARMRCAACEHRWVPEAEAAAAPGDDTALWRERPIEPPPPKPSPAEPLPFDRPFGEAAETAQPAVADPLPADLPPDDPDPPRPRIVATLAAIVIGLGLSALAAGLWLGDRMPELAAQLPGLDRIAPPAGPSPLTVTVRGVTAALPSGRLVLEVTGSIVNPTAAPQAVPPLAATLAGPAGVALRWTIAPPVRVLPAGHQVAFASTVTGFPAEATTLSVGPVR